MSGEEPSRRCAILTAMVTMDTLVSLCKRRGFIFQSSEIYGGTGSCWDYGPLGVELKNNIKQVWWRDFVQQRADMVGLDASILMHPTVWKASGHVDHFTDPMVDCRECRHRFRADQIDEMPWIHYCPATKGNKFTIPAGEACTHCGARGRLCPDCGKGELTAAAPVQPHVQDVHGAGGGGRVGHLPAPGDRAGHLRQLRQRAPVDAAQAPLRHRPDRQGVPQRDHAGQLHLPDARVRADGDRVLRQPPRDGGRAPGRRVLARPLDRGLPGVVPALRARSRTTCACTSTSGTSWRTTPSAPSTCSTGSRSAGAS